MIPCRGIAPRVALMQGTATDFLRHFERRRTASAGVWLACRRPIHLSNSFPPERPSGVRHRPILVFDPDVASLAFVAMALRRRGYEPVCAGSLEQASALLDAASSVTVAICFLRVGDLDGPALLAALKARPDARVIAVTAPGIEAHAADVAFVLPLPIVMLLRAAKRFAGIPGIAPPDESAESFLDVEPKRNRAK